LVVELPQILFLRRVIGQLWLRRSCAVVIPFKHGYWQLFSSRVALKSAWLNVDE
jgi:hypothetical protein